MTTMTIEQFKSLLSDGKWIHVQQYDVVDAKESEDSDGNPTWNYYGWAIVTSALNGTDDIKITYGEVFSYDQYEPDTLDSEPDPDENWKIEGLTVIDEDGRELDDHDVGEIIGWHDRCVQFTDFDYSELRDRIAETEDHDMDDDGADPITVTRDNAPDLRFVGELVASASSYRAYENDVHWTDLNLYQTRGGKFICEQIGQTRMVGQRTRYSGAVCENHGEVVEFFGHGWLAKELYESAGIEAAELID